YQASDDWLFMVALEQDLEQCVELADLSDLRDSVLERALEVRFRERSVDQWVQRLNKAGIAAQRVILSFHDLMKDPVVIEQGLSLTRFHEHQGMVTTTGPGIRLSRTPMSPQRPAPMPGTDAESILSEIGMAGDMERLIAQGVLVIEGVEPGGAS
ncbi:MAG: CoA transferase, partial [Pseudomonadota bacterium]